METLTLEHLSVYLPYGLKVTKSDWGKCLKVNIDDGILNQVGINYVIKTNAKPILYPLSSLTETIWYEGKEINPIEFIKDWYNEKHVEIDDLEYYCLNDKYVLGSEFGLFGAIHEREQTEAEIISMPYQAYQLLFKMKIDVFSLIEKGLAVDVNTLETNPYK
jgi:hypothetical protein